jgi:gliding motility-associated-like protein
MLVVNGAEVPGQNIWCQTITVQPNTDYAFSAWLATAFPKSPAELVFTINGITVGDPLIASIATGLWLNFSAIWNSGANTTITICISNQNTLDSGNDFALDDISFAPLCVYTDEVVVNVQPSPAPDLGPDAAVCAGTPVLLDGTWPNADAYAWQDGTTAPTLEATTTGWYWVDVTENGCTARDSVLVSLAPEPTVELGAPLEPCADETVTLNAGFPGATYLWSTGATTATLAVNSSGTYSVVVDLNGCTATDEVTVTQIPLPAPDLGPDVAVCADVPVVLDALWPTADAFAWQNGSTAATLVPGASGWYWVDVTENGCTARDSVLVNIAPLPTVELGAPLEPCADETVTLNASYPGATYLWNTGSTAATLSVSTTGTYSVVVDLNGCTATDAVEVTVIALPEVDLGPDTTVCPDEPVVVDATWPNSSYLWEDGSSAPLRSLTEPGLYWVQLSRQGCTVRDSLVIDHIPLPAVDLGPDFLLCIGRTAELEASGPEQAVLWDNGDTLPQRVIDADGTYSVTVSNVCGMEQDSITVTPDQCDCPVFVPSSFTPNGDGVNDLFRPQFDCVVQDYLIRIFDRWGRELWTSADPLAAWEGGGEGSVRDGIYAWTLQLRPNTVNENTLRKLRGHVVLLR